MKNFVFRCHFLSPTTISIVIIELCRRHAVVVAYNQQCKCDLHSLLVAFVLRIMQSMVTLIDGNTETVIYPMGVLTNW